MSESPSGVQSSDNPKRGQGKGSSPHDGGEDPSEEFEDDPDSDQYEDAQTTLGEFESEIDPNGREDTPVEGGTASGEPAIDGQSSVEQQPQQSEVDSEVVESVTDLHEKRDVVKIETADGETIVGRVDSVTVNPETDYQRVTVDTEFDGWVGGSGGEQLFSDVLGDNATTITRFDTQEMTDIPGVEQLDESEGGFNEIPAEATDPEELAENIRTFEEWKSQSGIGEEVSLQIPDDSLSGVRAAFANNIEQIKDDGLKRALAERTIIGGGRMQSGSAAIYTPNGGLMNLQIEGAATPDDNVDATMVDVRNHEIGHGIAQIRNITSSNATISESPDRWDSAVDPRDGELFKKFLHSKGAIGSGDGDGDAPAGADEEYDAHGWDDWADDAKQRVETTDSDNNAFRPVYDDVTTGDKLDVGDAIRFDDAPLAYTDQKEFQVAETADMSADAPELTVQDRNGVTHTMTVVGEGGEGIETGTMLVDRGAVEHVAPGYSDASEGDQIVGNSNFVDDNMPTVDEVRDGFDTQTWQEKADNFASQANRAFTEMWLRNELRGEKSPIQSDYSATKSHEVMSEVNELFQTSHESWLDDAERVATTYPELTGAYLDMMEPSDAVKGRFKKIDGVTLDTE